MNIDTHNGKTTKKDHQNFNIDILLKATIHNEWKDTQFAAERPPKRSQTYKTNFANGNSPDLEHPHHQGKTMQILNTDTFNSKATQGSNIDTRA